MQSKRMCCACGTRSPMTRLIRFQLNPLNSSDLIFSTSTGQKQKGRSAWICTNGECVNKVIKQPKKLARSLKIHNFSISYTTIQEWLWGEIRTMLLQIERDGALQRIEIDLPPSEVLYHLTFPLEGNTPWPHPIDIHSSLSTNPLDRDRLNLFFSYTNTKVSAFVQIHRHKNRPAIQQYLDTYTILHTNRSQESIV